MKKLADYNVPYFYPELSDVMLAEFTRMEQLDEHYITLDYSLIGTADDYVKLINNGDSVTLTDEQEQHLIKYGLERIEEYKLEAQARAARVEYKLEEEIESDLDILDFTRSKYQDYDTDTQVLEDLWIDLHPYKKEGHIRVTTTTVDEVEVFKDTKVFYNLVIDAPQ